MQHELRVMTSISEAVVQGDGWCLYRLNDITAVKKEWPHALHFDRLERGLMTLDPRVRGIVSRRAALRIIPVAFLEANRQPNATALAKLDAALATLLVANDESAPPVTGDTIYHLITEPFTRVMTAMEGALDAAGPNGAGPASSTIYAAWAADATAIQHLHDLPRMPEPEESNAFLAVCLDTLTPKKPNSPLWEGCIPTSAWLTGMAAMRKEPLLPALADYLARYEGESLRKPLSRGGSRNGSLIGRLWQCLRG